MQLDISEVDRVLQPFGFAAADRDQLLASMSGYPHACIRLRREKLRNEQKAASWSADLEPVPWHASAFWWNAPGRPGDQIQYAAGEYYIQDAASLLAVSLCRVTAGQLLCDLCAAPGGKTTALLDAVNDEAWVFAHEAVQSRLAPLELNLARSGHSRFVVSTGDVAQLSNSLEGCFDCVLVDAPCSGQSLVARGKQRGSAFAQRQVDHCAARQSRILDQAIQLVRPGGQLVYSTCTFSTEENEQQVIRLLDDHPRWKVDPEPAFDQWESPVLPGSYRLWPHRDRCLGGFATRLVHQGPQEPRIPTSGRELPATLQEVEIDQWGALQLAATLSLERRQFGWAEPLPEAFRGRVTSGPEICFRAGKQWTPSYALAMRRGTDWTPHRTTDLDDDLARQYLHGHPVASSQRGWTVATWQGKPLGWLKSNGSIGKNHLPKSARFR